ncbi:MAG: FAD-dependent monooxygenase [Burkholderiaceae bacterium]
MTLPIAILGGGPAGLLTALLLARAHVPSVVFDARRIDEARHDARLLALSRGSLQILAPLLRLPAAQIAPIKEVFVSSQGEFGRAVMSAADLGGADLGATIRYGDLLVALATAAAAQPGLIELRRPARVRTLLQRPDSVLVQLEDGGELDARLAVSAEGMGAQATRPPTQMALVGEVEVEGIAAGAAIERFTRDGPLALLPLPGRSARAGARWMSLVWCLPTAAAAARADWSETQHRAALQAQLGPRIGRVVSLELGGRFPLFEVARDRLSDHRLVYLGNSAQTLHPVAGQGFNLGVRDARELAARIAEAFAEGEDPLKVIPLYERSRRWDRRVLLALTRTMPGLFAERFTPLALARSLGISALGASPRLRSELAQLLMFGVRL